MSGRPKKKTTPYSNDGHQIAELILANFWLSEQRQTLAGMVAGIDRKIEMNATLIERLRKGIGT
jgi:hypothetical protein